MTWEELLKTYGVWPAAVAVMAMAYERIRREQADTCEKRIDALEKSVSELIQMVHKKGEQK